ncbi:MAG: hypothetical protein HKO79_02865 [Desulfobacterales bacterium]|nr:hypothetical protein [Desulfobacterales bacterium]
MFCIETEKLKLKLEIVPVSSLFIHEEVIPRAANKLILEFKNLASLQNPIIVDENHVVLDGNHRAHAFRVLNLKFIPVCKIDYFNRHTKLLYWFRLLGNVKRIDLLKGVITSAGGTFHRISDRSALKKALEENCLACGIQYGKEYLYVSFPERLDCDAVTAYNIIHKIQDDLNAQGVTLKYIPCNAVHKENFCVDLKADEAVIWTPQITKEMVVECAKLKKVFAPKTTRHVIPVRPLNVNLPGQWLSENISLDEINQRFAKFLKSKRMKKFSPGMVLDGRYYEEELIVFYR